MSTALEISEKEFDAQLFGSKKGLATMLGWTLAYHVLRSRGSQPGFPDRVLVRDRVLFVELKTEKGKPSDAQVRWLDALADAGAEAYLWRPSDLDEIAKVLSHRWVHHQAEPDLEPLLVRLGGHTWTPRSMWVAGEGRVDARP